MGIERLLDALHELEVERRLVAPHLVALHLADAVLGAEAAAEFGDDVVHDAVAPRSVRCMKPRRRTPGGADRL